MRKDEKKSTRAPVQVAYRIYWYYILCIKYYNNMCTYIHVYYNTLREYYYNIITPPKTTTAAVAADYLRVDRKNPLNAKQKLIGYYIYKKKNNNKKCTQSAVLKVVLDVSINYFGTIYYFLYTYIIQYNKYS
jgi:hypothetical protein